MKADPKTPATIYFLLGEDRGYRACTGHLETIEADIRYWLGKSPGIHMERMERIEVVPSDSKNYGYLIDEVHKEAAEQEARLREAQERENYERLKKKFENP